jgi:hypothetical protein
MIDETTFRAARWIRVRIERERERGVFGGNERARNPV